jgi:hypothetical protein
LSAAAENAPFRFGRAVLALVVKTMVIPLAVCGSLLALPDEKSYSPLRVAIGYRASTIAQRAAQAAARSSPAARSEPCHSFRFEVLGESA